MAVAAMGEMAMFPVTVEVGTLDMPDFGEWRSYRLFSGRLQIVGDQLSRGGGAATPRTRLALMVAIPRETAV
jgi:hypothetical protein